MQFSCLQENLNKGLSFVNRFVSSRPALPVLANILLKTEKGKLILSATNLEMGISFQIGGKIEKEGAITVPAKTFSELINSFPPGKIEFLKEENENGLKIANQNLKATINGLPPSEFPPFPLSTGKTTFSFPTNEIFGALSQVIFAAAQDEGRPVLNGVLFKGEKGKLTLAATDGFRLSVKELSCGIAFNFILPARALFEVVRILEEEKEKELKIEILEEKNQAIFCFSNGEILCRLFEGKFPDFEALIPKNFSTKAILEKELLFSSIKTLSVFARESSNIIKITLKPEGQDSKIKIEADAPQAGGGSVELEAKTEGEQMEVAFNYRFLLDFLNVVSQEEIIFQTSGPLSPGVFRPVGDESYLHIIMPVRIQPEEV